MTEAEQQTQRQNALDKGNEIRTYRKNVKQAVARGTIDPRLPLVERDPMLDGMIVEDYLRAIPGLGKPRVVKAMRRLEVPTETTIGALTLRQRLALMGWLQDRVERSTRWREASERFREAVA